MVPIRLVTRFCHQRGIIMKNFNIPLLEMVERFCRYVRIDTRSAEDSATYPSTPGQLDLCRLLQQELTEMGLTDVELTEHGYVFATIPATTDRDVPVIGLIAHVDTSPEVSGTGVQPVIHREYAGGVIVLPGDDAQVIQPDSNPALAACLGHDIITSDGTTLLGADNKAGVAEIMTAAAWLLSHPEVAHGDIRLAFTVDEEVGTGTSHFEVNRFGARYAYTIDGGTAGEIEDETFCADSVTIVMKGINMHPGYARSKMLNSQRVAAEFIDFLPKDTMSPETTSGREGYVHLHAITGTVEETVLKLLVRDFTVEGLKEKEEMIRMFLASLKMKHPRLDYSCMVEESYRNMKYVLDDHPRVTACAVKAIERAGLEPKLGLIRGGTDGARLSYMGLPTPNIFTGGHNFHSKTEWISVQDMARAVETIIHLVTIWAEEAPA
jgi:tripeptide aminopeptidase